MQKILFDTNAYSLLLKNDDRVVTVAERADTIYVSMVSVGELLAGFKMGSREKKNRKLLDEFVNQSFVAVLPVTRETAEIYAELVTSLKRNGTPIPLNDIWIAAHAIETGSILVTLDRHFLHIAGLRVWSHLRLAD